MAPRSRRLHDGTGRDSAHYSCRIYDCKPFLFVTPIDQFLALRGKSIYEGLGLSELCTLVLEREKALELLKWQQWKGMLGPLLRVAGLSVFS